MHSTAEQPYVAGDAMTAKLDRDRQRRLRQWLLGVIQEFGSNAAVASYINYSDGSQITKWLKSEKRPDMLALVKLARRMGDDPLEILRLGGYDDMANLLEGHVPPPQEVNERVIEMLKDAEKKLADQKTALLKKLIN